MPDAVAACRVCLAVEVRLLTIAGSLQLVYERITNNALHTADGRPVVACYICYAQLNKCRKLIRTSALAETVLNDILHRQSEITETSISQIDRMALGLCGSLRCCEVEHDDGEVPTPIVIKAEPESDIVKTEFGNEDSDDVAPAQTSCAGTRRQAEGSTTNRTQRESPRETTTPTAQGHHQCDVCQRRFTRPSQMMVHSRTHTGEKPYQCNVCDRRFNLKSTLLRHLSTHTGEKPFQCDVCHKAFKRKSHLLYHVKTHTGEKPFQCDVCYKVFTTKQYLIIHSRTHTGEKPFQCDVCHKAFTTKNYLINHSRTHTGEKPFQCNVCDHRFIKKYNLLRHLRTHTREKPFQCDVCHKAYKRKSFYYIMLKLTLGRNHSNNVMSVIIVLFKNIICYDI